VAGPPDEPPRVAFAIGRKVGTAVVRNRLRRRIRGGFLELVTEGEVRPGAYLIVAGAAATELTYEELKTNVRNAVAALGSSVAKARPRP
jgi:ribonuclease P protein component